MIKRIIPQTRFLDHFGVGLLDDQSDPSERLALPRHGVAFGVAFGVAGLITQSLDSRIDQFAGENPFPYVLAGWPSTSSGEQESRRSAV